MDKTERSTLHYYTGSGYAKINPSMREGKADASWRAAAKAIIKKSEELPEGVVVTHKVNFNANQIASMMKAPGTIIADPAFVSCGTKSPSGGTAWSGNVQMRLVTEKGVRGQWVGTHGAHPHEKEVILPPMQPIYITGVKKEGGILYVYGRILATMENQCCDQFPPLK